MILNLKSAIIVFVVTDDERNIGDQRLLEFKCIQIEPNLQIERLTLSDIQEKCKINEVKLLVL